MSDTKLDPTALDGLCAFVEMFLNGGVMFSTDSLRECLERSRALASALPGLLETEARFEKVAAFAKPAYVLLTNLTDDEECRLDHHGNCQEHHLERNCSNARASALLDEYGDVFDEMFGDELTDSGLRGDTDND